MASKKNKSGYAPGKNPNSQKALEANRKKTQFSGDVAVEMGQKGAEKSHEVQAERKRNEELMSKILDLPPLENNAEMLRKLGIPEDNLTNKTLLFSALFNRGLTGDPSAVMKCLEIAGQAPVNETKITGNPVSVIIGKPEDLPPDDY